MSQLIQGGFASQPGQPVTTPDGNIIAPSFNFSTEESTIYEFDHDGQEIWRYVFREYLSGSPAIGNDGTIYVGGMWRGITAIDSDLLPGSPLLWEIETIDGPLSINGCASPIIGDDGTLYVVGYEYMYPGNEVYLYAFNISSAGPAVSSWPMARANPQGTQKAQTTNSAINPIIAQTPISGPPGTTFMQWGTGFTPNSTAIMHVQKPDGTQYPEQNIPIDGTGNFEIEYTVPMDREPGTYTWWMVDGPTGIKSNEVSYEVMENGTSLNVPFFNQNDPLWACDQLGECKCDSIGECPDENGSCKKERTPSGCAITSLAMVFNYYVPGFTDPGRLNKYLTQNSGYDKKCLVKWSFTDESGNKVPFGAPVGMLYEGFVNNFNRKTEEKLEQSLDSGNPVIAKVSCKGVSNHFVVIVGKNNDQYLINDPWDGQRHSLNKGAFGNQYTVKGVHFYSFW